MCWCSTSRPPRCTARRSTFSKAPSERWPHRARASSTSRIVLGEAVELADRALVLKNGVRILEESRGAFDHDLLVRAIAGDEAQPRARRAAPPRRAPLLEARNLVSRTLQRRELSGEPGRGPGRERTGRLRHGAGQRRGVRRFPRGGGSCSCRRKASCAWLAPQRHAGRRGLCAGRSASAGKHRALQRPRESSLSRGCRTSAMPGAASIAPASATRPMPG